MKIRQQIPNLLTLTNLLSGCILVFLTAQTDISQSHTAGFPLTYIFISLIVISLICDLLDGMVARWLNATSPLGLQLDSLADMVTFGVFPGILMVKMLENTLSEQISILAVLGFAITLFSAMRLAKFNVDLSQTSYFKGLATPANAILIMGVFILSRNFPDFFNDFGFNTLLAVTLISSFLLVSNLPLFSFKMKSFDFKDNIPQLLLMISAVILMIFMGLNALAPIIFVYIIISIIFRKNFVHA